MATFKTVAHKLYVSALLVAILVGGGTAVGTTVVQAHDAVIVDRAYSCFEPKVRQLAQRAAPWRADQPSLDLVVAGLDQSLRNAAANPKAMANVVWDDEANPPRPTHLQAIAGECGVTLLKGASGAVLGTEASGAWSSGFRFDSRKETVLVSLFALVPAIVLVALNRWIRWLFKEPPPQANSGTPASR